MARPSPASRTMRASAGQAAAAARALACRRSLRRACSGTGCAPKSRSRRKSTLACSGAGFMRLFSQSLQFRERAFHRTADLWVVRGALTTPGALETVFPRLVAASDRGSQLHGEADALAHGIDFEHFHLDDVARLYNLAGVVDELVRQLADVHQAVLVHAQVDEGAKCRHVADRSFQLHAGLQVLDV